MCVRARRGTDADPRRARHKSDHHLPRENLNQGAGQITPSARQARHSHYLERHSQGQAALLEKTETRHEPVIGIE